jgi:hypothetical protein
VGLKLNRTHQLLAFVEDVNLLECLIDASKEVALEVNPDKTSCMLLSNYQNSG